MKNLNPNSKMAIFVGGLFLVVCFFLVMFLYNPFTGDKYGFDDVVPPGTQQEAEPITAAPLKTDKGEEKYHSYSLTYPDPVAGLKEITQYVDQSRAQLLEALPKDDAEAAMYGVGTTTASKYNITITTRIVRSTSTISYIIDNYMYTGGAHGGTDRVVFNYDQSGKLLALNDVLAGPDSLNKLSQAARTYFYKKLGTDEGTKSNIDTGTTPNAQNFERFYITNSTVVFVFGQYAIGPYVIGIQEFPVNRSQRDIIKF